MPHALERSIAVLLGPLLVLQIGFARQDGTSLGLRIVVVSGADAEHMVNQPAVEPLEVVVVDRDNILIPEARVVFTAPQMGPGGRFEGGSNVSETVTDNTGRAVAERYLPNAATGMYVIQVCAEFAGETATAIIPQTNVRGSRTSLMLTVLSLGAVLGAAIALSRGGGDGSTATAAASGTTASPTSSSGVTASSGPAPSDGPPSPGGGPPRGRGPTIRFGDSSVRPPP